MIIYGVHQSEKLFVDTDLMAILEQHQMRMT